MFADINLTRWMPVSMLVAPICVYYDRFLYVTIMPVTVIQRMFAITILVWNFEIYCDHVMPLSKKHDAMLLHLIYCLVAI